MLMVNAFVAVCDDESLTWIVSEKAPACVGVPEICPVVA
jgi:hypothetical protein